MSSQKAFQKPYFHSINFVNFSTNFIQGQSKCRNINKNFKVLKRLLYKKGDTPTCEGGVHFVQDYWCGQIFWDVTHILLRLQQSSHVSKQIPSTPIDWFFSFSSVIQPLPREIPVSYMIWCIICNIERILPHLVQEWSWPLPFQTNQHSLLVPECQSVCVRAEGSTQPWVIGNLTNQVSSCRAQCTIGEIGFT